MKTIIVYEDRDILVIQKPAGFATQTAKAAQQDVVSELKNYLASKALSRQRKGEPYLGIIHRLDQPVEGLLVFAKNKRAAASLTAQLNGKKEDGAGTLNKFYYGVFCGNAADKSGELVDDLYRDASGKAEVWSATDREEDSPYKDSSGIVKIRKRDVGEKPPQIKKAVLQYSIVQEETVQGHTLSLAKIHIDTGRYHQIRAQMAHAGMCLLGDRKYADAASQEISVKLNIRNVALCAFSLEFFHPATNEKMSFQIKPQGAVFSSFSFK